MNVARGASAVCTSKNESSALMSVMKKYILLLLKYCTQIYNKDSYFE